jgi:hypothetical protein
MPTPDASAFTRQKRLNAIQERNINDVKYLTHLYVYVPKATGLIDFLPSYKTKSAQPLVPDRKGVTIAKPVFTGLKVPYIK